ncbi:hypothetical protein VQ056_20180 [Paenibacillus sp. JTLBN-2024]
MKANFARSSGMDMWKPCRRTKVDVTAKSGDVVEWNGEQWIPNRALTAQRTKEIRTLMDDVWDD